MRRLVISLVIVASLGVVSDLGARAWAAGQIESRARAELPSQVSVSAKIRAFPFLPPLFLSGKVSEAQGHFERVPAGPLTFDAVDVTLRGVRVNRRKLINDRKVEIVDIREGTVAAELSAAALSRLIELPVEISGGRVRLRVAGALTVASARIEGKFLVFAAAGIEKRLAIPKTRLFPCASRVEPLAGRLRITCTIHDVPLGLLGEANRAING